MTQSICPVCGSLKFTSKWKKGEYVIGECGGCGLYYTSPLPDEKELKNIYGDSFFKPYIQRPDKKQKIFEKRIIWLENYCTGGKILDVGCEIGIFLELMKKRGWEVRGVEFSDIACVQARKKLGPVIFCGDIREAHFEKDYFDAVTFWHTLEHLTDPLGTLKEVWRILKPGGHLIVEVPNIKFIENYIFDMLGISKQVIFVEHLLYFSDKTLRGMIEKAGFTVKTETAADIVVTERDYKNLIEAIFIYLGAIIYSLTKNNLSQMVRIIAVKSEK